MFVTILTVKALPLVRPQDLNAGQKTIAVNPNGTSQNCSNCAVIFPKELSVIENPFLSALRHCDVSRLKRSQKYRTQGGRTSLLELRGVRRDTGTTKREAYAIL